MIQNSNGVLLYSPKNRHLVCFSLKVQCFLMKEDIKFNSPNFSKSSPSILMNERCFDSWHIWINAKSSIFLLLNASRNHIKWNGGGGASFSYELKTAFGHVSSHYYTRREVVIQVFFCAYVDCNRWCPK